MSHHLKSGTFIGIFFWYYRMIGVKDEAGKDVYPVVYTWSTIRDAAGTKVYYTHEKNQDADKVFIPGPTNQHLYVYVRH